MADPKSAGGGLNTSAADQPRRRRKLSAIMMADVSGFSRMMGQDEERTIHLIKDFHERVQHLVSEFEGRVVDTAGDSVFGEFDSVVNAVQCALRIQEEQATRNAGRAAEERVDTRIGVHLGDVIIEDYHVYGDGVNIAARLDPLADPGGICISEAVYQQVRNKLALPVEDIGLRELKNIEHPIRLYKVGPAAALEVAPVMAPAAAGPVPQAPRPPAGPPPSFVDELLSTTTLVLLAVGGALLLSPVILFRSQGAVPTAGAIVVAVGLGRVWARCSRRSGNLLIALGLGLTSGALWTNWTPVTNTVFVLAGLIVAATGVGKTRRLRR